MYTTRPSGGGIDRNAYGTIQILHPDAYHMIIVILLDLVEKY